MLCVFKNAIKSQKMAASVDVMVSILALWGRGPQIDTWSGTFNGNHYFNKWIETYICYLVDDVGIECCAIHCRFACVFSPGGMRLLQECVHKPV